MRERDDLRIVHESLISAYYLDDRGRSLQHFEPNADDPQTCADIRRFIRNLATLVCSENQKRTGKVAVDKLGADSFGKLVICMPPPEFIPVPGPPPPSLAAAVRGPAPQDGSDRGRRNASF